MLHYVRLSSLFMHQQCSAVKDTSAFCTLRCITLYCFTRENSHSFNISGIAFFLCDCALLATIKVQSLPCAISSVVLDASGSRRTHGRSKIKISKPKEKAHSKWWHALILARLISFSLACAFKGRGFAVKLNWSERKAWFSLHCVWVFLSETSCFVSWSIKRQNANVYIFKIFVSPQQQKLFSYNYF